MDGCLLAVASASMFDGGSRRLRRLAEELDESGLRLEGTEASREILVREIDYALRPVVHERRAVSGGAIVEPMSDPATWASAAELEITRGPVDQPLSDARRFADGFSSFAKLAAGHYTDQLKRRKPLAVFGYAFTALATASFGLATHAVHVLLGRSAAWLGRGVRSPFS